MTRHYRKAIVVACADCGSININRADLSVMQVGPARSYSQPRSHWSKPRYSIRCECAPVELEPWDDDDDFSKLMNEIVSTPWYYHDVVVVAPSNP